MWFAQFGFRVLGIRVYAVLKNWAQDILHERRGPS